MGNAEKSIHIGGFHQRPRRPIKSHIRYVKALRWCQGAISYSRDRQRREITLAYYTVARWPVVSSRDWSHYFKAAFMCQLFAKVLRFTGACAHAGECMWKCNALMGKVGVISHDLFIYLKTGLHTNSTRLLWNSMELRGFMHPICASWFQHN